MITSSIRVACRNFRGTHKFLRVHHVFEETLLSAVCAGQSQRHGRPGWHFLVTVSPTRTNAHAHPSLRSHPSGHVEFNIIDTSLTSGQSCLSASTRSQCPFCGNLPSVTYSTMYRPRMFARWAVRHMSSVNDASCGVNLRCTFQTCTVREHKGNYGVNTFIVQCQWWCEQAYIWCEWLSMFETCTVREHKGNYGVNGCVLCVNDIAFNQLWTVTFVPTEWVQTILLHSVC